MNFLEFLNRFSTEQAIINHFVTIRYKQTKPFCNHCGCTGRIVVEKNRPKFFHCNDCNASFSIFKDTIFEKTTTDLRKWFYAIHLFINGKKGISGYQLKREVGVTYKTAWRMLKQIRLAMGNSEALEFTQTVIEIDETYVGGKPRKGDKKHGKAKRGRGTRKTPVVGVIDRNSKKVHARVALPNKAGKSLSGVQLLNILNEVAHGQNTIITDEFRPYGILKKTDNIHLRIDHSKAFVTEGNVHTNTIEGFWSNLKRGIIGIYHQVSKKYLQNYLDEFTFRYNNRHDLESQFNLVLKQCVI